jgi:hypothetical protein
MLKHYVGECGPDVHDPWFAVELEVVDLEGFAPSESELRDADGHETSELVQGLSEALVDVLESDALGQVVGKVGGLEIDPDHEGEKEHEDAGQTDPHYERKGLYRFWPLGHAE